MINFGGREAVEQNLKDAGCSKTTIENFLAYFDEERTREQLTLLEAHRGQLLKKVHEQERRISCLDYLIYQIRK